MEKLQEETSVIRDAENISNLENFKTLSVLSAEGLPSTDSRNTSFSSFPSSAITSWTIFQTTLEGPSMPETTHWAG